jgi:flagellar hook protein FlgE
MYSAISGLEGNSTWLDVIGNNIANTNTVAYKASRVEFADQISQTLLGGTGDNQAADLGGIDPQQVGLGTKVNSIQTIFTEGTLQQTGISTDIAIVGNGFLVSKNNGSTLLTRAGNLVFDSAGNLVDANGGLIQGFTAAVQYTQNMIDTAADSGTVNLNVTSAKLTLNNLDPAAAQNIKIPATLTEPPLATTQVNFSGNLDAFQQANAAGGILNLGAGTAASPAILPLGLPGEALGGAEPVPAFGIIPSPTGVGQVVHQLANPDEGVLGPGNAAGEQEINGNTNDSANWTNPIVSGAISLGAVQAAFAAGTTDFAWDQQPPAPPAKSVVETVYNSNGNPVQITVNFYQVNDLGTSVPPINNPQGPDQVAYAWYAFNTTDGAPVSTDTLVGGTGIFEGETSGPGPATAITGYDRGLTNNGFWGDLLVFNTDGSLLTTGGVQTLPNGIGYQSMPDIYIDPENIVGPPVAPPPPPGANNINGPASPLPTAGAEIMQIQLNFGSAGVLGKGERNGLYSDADGSYQTVNGVNTYIPNSTAYAQSQNGYAEGLLQSIQFDETGTIQGTFSNGQTTALGQVILAEPNNPDGLNNVGDNYYSTSPNAGPVFVGTAGQLDLGTVQGNTLELSNVDLSVELSNMIIAQRGFETNARVISVESADMQTLTQLGQGG